MGSCRIGGKGINAYRGLALALPEARFIKRWE